MTRRTRRLPRVVTSSVAVLGAGALLAASAGPAAALASDEPEVVNTETVRTRLLPSGEVDESELLSQLTVTGDGTYEIVDPTAPSSARDLDGFSAPDVRDGQATYEVEVDGTTERRTLADFPEERLPITVEARYTLDGEVVEAEDVVGESGRLEVRYEIANATGEPTEIDYLDFDGQRITKTVDVVVPLVGELTTTLPAGFSGVDARRARVAGDGEGGSALTFDMVLFGPIGDPVQVLTWSADVVDAELPPAEIAVAPVVLEDSPDQAVVLRGYDEAGAAGNTLAGGANQISGGLGKLAAGAGTLLDGLNQLSDGANQLNSGLADTAAPGAQTLADGLATANTGSGSLAAGLAKLDAGTDTLSAGLSELLRKSTPLVAGTAQLDAGAARAAQGAEDLQAGLAKISGGLDQLSGVSGLPAAQKGLQELRFGIDHPAGALGATDPGGLLQGLTRIAGGLSNPACDRANPTAAANPCGVLEVLQLVNRPEGLPAALAGVTASRADLDAKIASGDLDRLVAGATGVQGGLGNALSLLASTCGTLPSLDDADPRKAPLQGGCDALLPQAAALNGAAQAVTTGVTGVRSSTITSRDNLVGLQAGLTTATQALTSVQAGVVQLAAGAASARDGVRGAVLPGLDKLIAGVTSAVTGLDQLAPGGRSALTGAGTLATGLDQLSAGTGSLAGSAPVLVDGITKLEGGGTQLSTGAGDAAAGASKLDDGLGQLAEGGQKLATGLGGAADGSGRLAEGLLKAVAGPEAIIAGTEKLTAEGAGALKAGGNRNAAINFERAETLRAMSARASEALPFGAPEGATGLAAYEFTLAGATADASDSALRGGVAAGLIAVAGATGLVLHRRRA